MRRTSIPLALAVLVAGLLPRAPAAAGLAGGPTLAGVAKIDSTWHVGASSGQYAGEGPGSYGSWGIDPTTHSTTSRSSYGLHSREWVRALVVQGPDGKRVAVVSNDLYIPQDLVNRRVAGLLGEHDRNVDLGLAPGPKTGINDSNMTISVSHSHSSPYYSTPSWGVWTFQDVFDIRFFEHIARKMADAVIAATHEMRRVRIGGSVSYFDKLQRHSFGPQIADDGTPAGFPDADFADKRTVAKTENEKTVTVIRIDDISGEVPAPLANWVVFGLHPEMLDGNDLLTGEYVNTMYRIVDREVGGITLFSQQNTGTSEPARDAKTYPASARLEFSHREYAQMERAARMLADAVKKTRNDIANGTPEDPNQFSPFQTDAPVSISDFRFAPPSLRALASVSSCRTERAFNGDPGVPILGLPDCEFPLGGTTRPVFQQLPLSPSVTYEMARQAGIPIPDNTSAPSYTGLEETLQVHLQAIRLGGIGITVCPCEQWGDQSRNIRTRLNKITGDLWDGFDWTQHKNPAGRDWCVPGDGTTWTCANPRNPSVDLPPIADARYQRMRAQIHNDAAGWEDPSYAPYAETEEVDIAKVKGNYTKEELTPFGYDLVVPVGMSNDYWGYIATYREYQRGDHYRKALTGLGPHSSDFLATRLTRMAASLNGGPAVQLSAKDLAYSAENVHEYQRAQVIGQAGGAVVRAYQALLPVNGGVAAIVSQPGDITRFQAATVTWIGGDNFTDTPHARVQRYDEDAGAWVEFGDGTGEVQVKANFPQPADMPAYLAGQFQWKWDATFEAFNSDIPLPDESGVVRTQTPAGTYRFTVDGVRREETPAQMNAYRLISEPFEVRPWDGITVTDVAVSALEVSFGLGPVNRYTYGSPTTYSVGPIDYPDTYASPFRFIQGRDRPSNLRGGGEQFCFECSFRPWADTGGVPKYIPVVLSFPDGHTETVNAVQDGARYVVSRAGDATGAVIEAGAIVDSFGERNGEEFLLL